MGFQEEMKRNIRNVKHDVALAIDRTWKIDHNGDVIEVHNELMCETLTVNGVIIAQTKRKSIWSHLFPMSYLKGTYIGNDGRKRKIKVALGGIIELNVKVKVDGVQILHEKMKFEMQPWDNKTAIMPNIEAQVAEGTLQETLPDDYLLYGEGEPHLPPGLADQIFAEVVPTTYPNKLVKLLQKQLDNPTTATRKATYEKVLEARLIDYLDMFMYEMREANLSREKLLQEAAWFIDHATHREVLKFGIALFGFTEAAPYKERLQAVAVHEEFTGVALFALQNGRALSNDFTLELCKTLPGWGKVAAIDFLEADTDAIRQWLLTDAIDSTVMPEYIAMYCVEKGKLDILLHEPQISSVQYEGANKLLRTLLEHNHHDRLDMYEYTGQIMQRFVYHGKTHAKTMMHFYTLALIARYMEKEETQWDELFGTSWQPFQRNMVLEGIREVASSGSWREEAYHIVMSERQDDEEALLILQYYRENVNNRLLQKLSYEKDRYTYYEMIVESADLHAIREAANIAATLPFEAMNDDSEMSILLLLEYIANDDGAGKILIDKVLRSGEVSLVYNALHTLSMWHADSRRELHEAIAIAEKENKDKEVRKLAKQLLQ